MIMPTTKSGKPQLLKSNPVKLDLACGSNKQQGFVGVDIAGDNVDIKFNLEQYPWTFAEDESVTEIFISHYVEHIPHHSNLKTELGTTVDGWFAFWDEVYRILVPGGKVTVIAPYHKSTRCWQDPTHIRGISEASFVYCNKQWRETNRLQHYPVKCDFDYSYGYNFALDMQVRFATMVAERVTDECRRDWDVIDDIQAVLTKR